VLAIVGGTGITGALSLGNWWISQQSTTPLTKQRLKVVWSVRDIKMADIAEVHAFQERLLTLDRTADLEIHVSSQSGRLLPGSVLDNFIEAQPDSADSTFVYISGPEGLAAGAETACIRQQKQLRASSYHNRRKEISWHNATFTV
jgi:ferredoxin-NADP reductase